MSNVLFPAGTIFMNPNEDKSVVETAILNQYFAILSKDEFFRKFTNVSKTGFEINFMDFKWELNIVFNQRSGFMVFRETGRPNQIKLYVYSHVDDLHPKEILINNAIPIDGIVNGSGRLLKLIKFEYKNLQK